MPEDTKVNIFADENQPRVMDLGKITTYRIDIPNQHFDYYVVLWVREDGYAEIQDFKFYGERGPMNVHSQLKHPEEAHKAWEAQKEVWDWLMEWELVELKPIGPEDSEYFITDLLEKEAAKGKTYDKEAGW